MQLTKTIFSDSAIFIEKKRVENQLWAKSEFLWAKKNASFEPPSKISTTCLQSICEIKLDDHVATTVLKYRV